MNDFITRFSDSNLFMRLANESDSQQLLSWRNNPVVRKYSRNVQVISRETHDLWLKNKLGENHLESKIYIFSDSRNFIGMSRIDSLSVKLGELSILVDPLFHSKGYGSKILNLSIEVAFDLLKYSELAACIHRDNLASKALFSKYGFIKSHDEDLFEFFKLSKIV